MSPLKWPVRRCVVLAALFTGIIGEPIFFYGRGKEISRKRSFHPFSPRPPAHRPPPPPNRVPCVPNFAPRTKFITKTTSVYKTIYETEFFPKTVFDTNFKSGAFEVEPSTVTKTSTTTSTIHRTKVEPVYVTTTEFETTSMTSTITHLVYDTRQQISSLLHTRAAPEVLTKTIVQDVYHTDIETVFNSRTVTVTRTENIVNTDCPTLPEPSSDRPFLKNYFDPRGKFNREHLRAAFLHAPLDPDPYSEITHANSEPLKTFAGPLPINEFDGKGSFSPLYHGTTSHFSPIDPLSFQLPSFPGNSHVQPPYGSLPFSDNKFLNSFSASPLDTYEFQNYLPDGGYSSRYHSVAKSPIPAYTNDDETDDYVPFTSKDIEFAPSRPDPTSISDIIDNSYDSNEKEGNLHKSRQPKLLFTNEGSPYGTKSIYSPKLTNSHKSFLSDSLRLGGHSNYGSDIHIKEVLEGVKGGEIVEEIHQHGIVEPSHVPLAPILSPFGSHISKYSGSYHESPPVYEFKNRNSDYTAPQPRKSSLLHSQYESLSKKIHPLVPKEIENNGFAKSSSESMDHQMYTKSPVAAIGISRNHNSQSVSVRKPYSSRTLFRSEVLESKRVPPGERNRSFRDLYGAHSMPIVTNIAGTELIELYKNTSSNTHTPPLGSMENGSNEEQRSVVSNADETNSPVDSERPVEKQGSEPKIFTLYEKNDWIPLVPFESLKTYDGSLSVFSNSTA